MLVLNHILSVTTAAERTLSSGAVGGMEEQIEKKRANRPLDLTTIFEVNDHDNSHVQPCLDDSGDSPSASTLPGVNSDSDQSCQSLVSIDKAKGLKSSFSFVKKLRRLSQYSLNTNTLSSFLTSSTSLPLLSSLPRLDLRQRPEDTTQAGAPDITVTNAAGGVSSRNSGSVSGSETSPESDQQGGTVTLRRAGSDLKAASGSSENVSAAIPDRKSSQSRKSSPIPTPDAAGPQSKTSSSPGVAKQDRKSVENTIVVSTAQPHSTSGTGEKSKLQSAAYHIKNFLAPNYKTRAEEFKKLFKPPENDKFVIDYSCAYQKEILVHGRMYMSQNWLCFYSIIFKWETTLTIRFKDIVSITKEKTAKIIPNAIQVCTKVGEKLFFASFSMRDKAYMMMFKIWQNALLDQPMNPAELWVWANHGYDESEFSASDQEAEDALITLTDEPRMTPAALAAAVENDCQNLRRLANSAPRPVPPLVGLAGSDSVPGSEEDSARSKMNEEANEAHLSPTGPKIPRVSSGGSLSRTAATTPAEDYTESENEVEINCPCASHAGKEMLNCVYPMSVDQLFLLLFTDSVFFRKVHEDRKTTDLVLSDWRADKGVTIKSRQITYVIALNHSIGPKTCSVTETQVCTSDSKPGQLYVMKCDVCNMGVPYSDSFSIGVQYCLSRVSANQCRIRVHASVVYKKSCWGIVKSFIEKNALNGVQDYFSDLNTHLHAECARYGLTDAAEDVETKRSSSRLRRRASKAQPAAAETTKPSPAKKTISSTALAPLLPSEVEKIAKAILVVLIVMLLLNAALFYKLWYFESEADRGSFETAIRDFETVLKKSDLTSSEWVQLFYKVRFAQKKQLARWLEELDLAIQHVGDVEAALIEMRKQITMMRKNFGPGSAADRAVESTVTENSAQ